MTLWFILKALSFSGQSTNFGESWFLTTGSCNTFHGIEVDWQNDE